MLKKTSTRTGLVIVTAAGALLTSSPAFALESIVRGSHSRTYHRSHHRNHNWNGHNHHGRIFIRIYIYNKNNNHAIAIAKPEHRRHHRDVDGVHDGVVPASARGGVVAQRRPARSFRDTAPVEPAPAPAAAPVDDGTANNAPSTAAAPATSGTAPALDEAATG